MLDAPSRVVPTAADKDLLVILIEPSLLGTGPDLRALDRTLTSAADIRVLLYLSDRMDQTIVDALTETGRHIEILLGRGLELPQTASFVLQVLPDTSERDQIEFVLALSDVVLAAPGSEASGPVARRAAELGKPVLTLGNSLPAVPRTGTTTDYLDPDHWGSQRWPRCFGRCEQSIIELLAFNWLGSEDGIAESRKQLRGCWSPTWRPASYFAPGAWRELAPDRSAIDGAATIVSRFDAMDRSAVFGAYVQRDFVWWEYLGAASAVLLAVLGAMVDQPVTALLEGMLLSVVAALVLFARHVRLQDRWTARRLGAEQLRIARMSLPLLVVPPALSTADAPPAGNPYRTDDAAFGLAALAEVKRAIRGHGLPRVDPALTADQAAKWLQLIVRDQSAYHNLNHRKLKTAERRLHFITRGLFVGAFLAVLYQLRFGGAEWLLLFTAAAPAFAAALQGAIARLGIVHRVALSAEAHNELTRIDDELARSIERPAETTWRRVRRLAFEAAEAMGRENTSWHSLMRHHRDDLP